MKVRAWIPITLFALAVFACPAVVAAQIRGELGMKRMTPVLIVDEIEPCLELLVERLGFEKTAEVPEGNRLGFVILKNGPVEVMYQSRASVQNDIPALAKDTYRTSLFIEVEDLEAVMPKLKGFEVVVPDRTTFYGAREYAVREPGGNIVCFAQFTSED